MSKAKRRKVKKSVVLTATGAVKLTLEVSITPDEIKEWDAERIGALLHGMGRLAFISRLGGKADVDKMLAEMKAVTERAGRIIHDAKVKGLAR